MAHKYDVAAWKKARAAYLKAEGSRRQPVTRSETRHGKAGTVEVPLRIGERCNWSYDENGEPFPTIVHD